MPAVVIFISGSEGKSNLFGMWACDFELIFFFGLRLLSSLKLVTFILRSGFLHLLCHLYGLFLSPTPHPCVSGEYFMSNIRFYFSVS